MKQTLRLVAILFLLAACGKSTDFGPAQMPGEKASLPATSANLTPTPAPSHTPTLLPTITTTPTNTTIPTASPSATISPEQFTQEAVEALWAQRTSERQQALEVSLKSIFEDLQISIPATLRADGHYTSLLLTPELLSQANKGNASLKLKLPPEVVDEYFALFLGNFVFTNDAKGTQPFPFLKTLSFRFAHSAGGFDDKLDRSTQQKFSRALLDFFDSGGSVYLMTDQIQVRGGIFLLVTPSQLRQIAGALGIKQNTWSVDEKTYVDFVTSHQPLWFQLKFSELYENIILLFDESRGTLILVGSFTSLQHSYYRCNCLQQNPDPKLSLGELADGSFADFYFSIKSFFISGLRKELINNPRFMDVVGDLCTAVNPDYPATGQCPLLVP